MASIERARIAREAVEQEKLDKAARSAEVNKGLVGPGARPKPAPVAPTKVKPVAAATVRARPQRPKQEASLGSRNSGRMIAPVRHAGEKISQILDVNGMPFRKWTEVDRERDDSNWHERTYDGWMKHNVDVRNRMQGFVDNNDVSSLDAVLRSEGYKAEDEIESAINDLLSGDRGRDGNLRQVRYNVPAAVADEQVAIQALRAAGVTDVKPGNLDPAMGTDIRGYLDGEPVTIDAQQRLGQSGMLNLGVYGGARQLVKNVMDNPDTKLLDLIDTFRSRNPGQGYEDKLLQTTNSHWNKDPGTKMQRDPDSFDKGALISAFRPDIRGRRGPYNPTLPESYKYFDLNEMREDLLNRSLNSIVDTGRGTIIGGKDLKLALRPEYLDSLSIPLNMSQVNNYLRG
jgi:hypothetical protein